MIKKIILGIVTIFIILVLFSDKKNPDVTNTTKDISYVSEPSTQLTTNVPQSLNSRLLGVGITEGNVGFDTSLSIAQDIGIDVTELQIFWNETEPKPKKYVDGYLPAANIVFPKENIKLGISINPIDTNQLRVPEDLEDKPFDDPELIQRYKDFVDFVAIKLSDTEISHVSVGNEIDVYLGNSKERWQEYENFFKAVYPHIQSKFPEALIGSKITFDGIRRNTAIIKQYNSNAGVILVTYYPFTEGAFVVRDPSEVHGDFEYIVKTFPDKKIFFSEIGYPSGSANNSSEEKQADFIREAFAAWDTHSDRITLLNFLWLHDISPKAVSDFRKYYGINDEAFLSFLGTLGLRTHEGVDKKGLTTLKKEAGLRK